MSAKDRATKVSSLENYSGTPLNDHLWWAAALSTAATNLGLNCTAIQNSTPDLRPPLYSILHPFITDKIFGSNGGRFRKIPLYTVTCMT